MANKNNKYHGRITLTSDTFAQVQIKLGNNRKDIYIHRINWVIDPTDYSESIADKPIIQLQLTSRSQSAIIPLQPGNHYREHVALVNQQYTGAGTLTNDNVVSLADIKDFKKPIHIPTDGILYVGIKSIFAGTFSIRILGDEVDVVM